MTNINEHFLDRTIRFVIAAALIFMVLLDWPFVIPLPWALIAYLVSVVLIVTSVIGFCPLYRVFNFSTAGKQK